MHARCFINAALPLAAGLDARRLRKQQLLDFGKQMGGCMPEGPASPWLRLALLPSACASAGRLPLSAAPLPLLPLPPTASLFLFVKYRTSKFSGSVIILWSPAGGQKQGAVTRWNLQWG